MFLRRILLSGIATIALCGAAMAAGTAASPATGSGASPYPSTTGAADATGTTGAIGAAGASASTGTAISAITNPQTALKSASVQSADGTKVGKVSKVHVDSSGQAQSIDVKVGAKTVSLPAAQATFDESNKIVVAQLSASDLKKLPAPGKTLSPGMTSSPSTGTNPSTTGNAPVPDVAPGSTSSPSGGAPSNQ